MAIAAIYRACGSDGECIKRQVRGAAERDPRGVIEAVLALSSRPDAPPAGCHWAMHLIGQVLEARTLAGDDLGIDDLWSVCGYAVLHGAYEELDIAGETDDVGRQAFALCLNGTLSGNLVGQCFHPIGHSIERNLAGSRDEPWLHAAERACAAGAWHVRDALRPETALKACVSGAHMRHRDNVVLPGSDRPWIGSENPADVLPECANSLLPYACITLYIEDALGRSTPEGKSAAARLLAWCVELDPEAAQVCGYFYGNALRGDTRRPVDDAVIDACDDAGQLGPGVDLACLRGVLDRTDVRGGLDREGFCAAVARRGGSCEPVTEFTVTYPELPDPASMPPASRTTAAS